MVFAKCSKDDDDDDDDKSLSGKTFAAADSLVLFNISEDNSKVNVRAKSAHLKITQRLNFSFVSSVKN